MSFWALVLIWLAIGLVTWFVFMFLSALNSWGIDDLMGPLVMLFWPLAIFFGLLVLLMTQVNRISENAASKVRDWLDERRFQKELERRRKERKYED